jgi:hypothetical protein
VLKGNALVPLLVRPLPGQAEGLAEEDTLYRLDAWHPNGHGRENESWSMYMHGTNAVVVASLLRDMLARRG